MILTVNIGNTHITVGGYEQDTLRFCGRLHSDTGRNGGRIRHPSGESALSARCIAGTN